MVNNGKNTSFKGRNKIIPGIKHAKVIALFAVNSFHSFFANIYKGTIQETDNSKILPIERNAPILAFRGIVIHILEISVCIMEIFFICGKKGAMSPPIKFQKEKKSTAN